MFRQQQQQQQEYDATYLDQDMPIECILAGKRLLALGTGKGLCAEMYSAVPSQVVVSHKRGAAGSALEWSGRILCIGLGRSQVGWWDAGILWGRLWLWLCVQLRL